MYMYAVMYNYCTAERERRTVRTALIYCLKCNVFV